MGYPKYWGNPDGNINPQGLPRHPPSLSRYRKTVLIPWRCVNWGQLRGVLGHQPINFYHTVTHIL